MTFCLVNGHSTIGHDLALQIPDIDPHCTGSYQIFKLVLYLEHGPYELFRNAW